MIRIPFACRSCNIPVKPYLFSALVSIISIFFSICDHVANSFPVETPRSLLSRFQLSDEHNLHKALVGKRRENLHQLLYAYKADLDLEKSRSSSSKQSTDEDLLKEIERAERAYGMPWQRSLRSTFQNDDVIESKAHIEGYKNSAPDLCYMPFWEWQLEYMKNNLSNLSYIGCSTQNGDDMAYRETSDGKGRIHSICFQSDEYRHIRMTYYDQGDVGQNFNTMWYPHYTYNLPILGVNLLSRSVLNKHLAIIDFQPLHKAENDHVKLFSSIQRKITKLYPELESDPDDRVLDLQVFSKNMICKRFSREAVVIDSVFPAFHDYVLEHVNLVHTTDPDESANAKEAVMKRHAAYDLYSAVRDPCRLALGKVFGNEWANDFVFEFLYPLCGERRTKEDYWG